MTEPKRPLKVFLCHAHADRDPVRGLYTRLTQDGVDAWLDKAKLLPGQDWELEIRKAVREADVVVVCLSKQFNQAGFRQKEVRLALDTAMEKPEGEIFIIPARLEECDTLESLRKWHWVDLFEEDGYEMLMRALRARADRIGAVLFLSQKAQEILVDKKVEQEKRVKILQRQAKSFEENGKLDEALEVYLEIEKIDPFIVGIDQKIVELQKKIRSNNLALNLLNANGNQQRKSTQKNEFSRRGLSILAGVIGIVFCVVTISLASLLPTLIKGINETPVSTQALTEVSLATEAPTAIEVPMATEITDAKGVQMVLVPAGEFIMGSEWLPPVRNVYLDSFYIDKFEVTNSFYANCVNQGICAPPSNFSSSTRPNYFGNAQYSNYPVIYVDWNQAKTFCEWRDSQLPTETQWEKTARGTDGRIYPWGEGIDCKRANYNSCVGDTTEVGSYENGKSPYGAYDMSGNVFEWVSDLYNQKYHVQRGGSFYNVDSNADAITRDWAQVVDNPEALGFRCAKDANP